MNETIESLREDFEARRKLAAEDYFPGLPNHERCHLIKTAVRRWVSMCLGPKLKQERFKLYEPVPEGWESRRLAGESLQGISLWTQFQKSSGSRTVTYTGRFSIAGAQCFLMYFPEEYEQTMVRVLDMINLHFFPYRKRPDTLTGSLNGVKDQIRDDLDNNFWLERLFFQLEDELLSSNLICPWSYRSPLKPTKTDRQARRELEARVAELETRVAALENV